MSFKEGRIVNLKSRSGLFVIDQVPITKDGLYVMYKYNYKYHLLYIKEDDILPLPPHFCWHSFKTIDIGLGAKYEIRYCETCGIKMEDLEKTRE